MNTRFSGQKQQTNEKRNLVLTKEQQAVLEEILRQLHDDIDEEFPREQFCCLAAFHDAQRREWGG